MYFLTLKKDTLIKKRETWDNIFWLKLILMCECLLVMQEVETQI